MQPKEKDLVSEKPVGTPGTEYLVGSVCPGRLVSLSQSLLRWKNIKLKREIVQCAASWGRFVRSIKADFECSPQGFLTPWDTQRNSLLRIFSPVICVRL